MLGYKLTVKTSEESRFVKDCVLYFAHYYDAEEMIISLASKLLIAGGEGTSLIKVSADEHVSSWILNDVAGSVSLLVRFNIDTFEYTEHDALHYPIIGYVKSIPADSLCDKDSGLPF